MAEQPRGSESDAERPACGPGCACAVGNEFGEREVRRELRSYRRSGPPRTTRWLIDGLRADGVGGMSVLDIGAGVGAVHQELLADGAARAIDVDGSPAFVDAARDEAARRGTAERIRYEVGDFVALAPTIEPADLVALDRVICCYPDMAALVRLSVARARVRYGIVYPRDTWWVRLGGRLLNGLARLFRQRTRAWVHRSADVEAIVGAAGFRPRFRQSSLFWQVAVYDRAPA
ncbi:MAG TPA: methyltransferase domain-containing protein [Candidatus Limnocylindrales bacterium]|nr:methyltransferase domain-containing protein [Candidatus Limnocylindrales bacterium]